MLVIPVTRGDGQEKASSDEMEGKTKCLKAEEEKIMDTPGKYI
jgi:hypothetical protein